MTFYHIFFYPSTINLHRAAHTCSNPFCAAPLSEPLSIRILIEFFSVMPVFATSLAQFLKCHDLYQIHQPSSFIFLLLLCLIINSPAHQPKLQLIRIFGTESALYEEFAVKCFHIYLLLTFLNGLQMCAGVLFQAIGQPMKAAITSLSKQIIFYIPAMLILSRFFGLTGILMAGPVADALAFILSGAFCFKEIKKMEQINENAS